MALADTVRRLSSSPCALTTMALRRIQKEWNDFAKDAPPGCKVALVGDDLWHWTATVDGPEETPFAGGVFTISVDFPPEYPHKPPSMKFKTRIYHPNVKEDGGICLDVLKEGWTPVLTIAKLCLSIVSFLSTPNCDQSLMPDIAAQYKSDREAYNKTAREWTAKYATAEGVASTGATGGAGTTTATMEAAAPASTA